MKGTCTRAWRNGIGTFCNLAMICHHHPIASSSNPLSCCDSYCYSYDNHISMVFELGVGACRTARMHRNHNSLGNGRDLTRTERVSRGGLNACYHFDRATKRRRSNIAQILSTTAYDPYLCALSTGRASTRNGTGPLLIAQGLTRFHSYKSLCRATIHNGKCATNSSVPVVMTSYRFSF